MTLLRKEPIVDVSTSEEEYVSLRYLFPRGRLPLSYVHDFIKQVESVYRGLGIPALYGTLSLLANKSVFFIGGRGIGKTRLINCIPDIKNVETSKWDTFTLGELDNLCAKYSDDSNSVFPGLSDKYFVFKVEDFSTLSEYHRTIFLTVCSKISSDGNYRHVTSITPNLNIENCKLTMLIAIQPRLYSLLCNRYTQWESMSYDRFTKFMLLNPLREGITIDSPFVPTLPQKIPSTASLPTNINVNKLFTLFNGHVSGGRAYLYARDYAKAMARFLGEDTVKQEHVDKFHKMFSPYLESFSELQQRQDLESTVTVSSGHMELLTEIGKHLDGVNKQQLAESLRVSVRHVERGASFLLSKELIREEERKYHLSNDLEQFFHWYKDTFSV